MFSMGYKSKKEGVYIYILGFPGGSDDKESACSVGDPGLIPELARFPWRREGYPLQYSCLENPINRAAWWTTVYGVANGQARLSN